MGCPDTHFNDITHPFRVWQLAAIHAYSRYRVVQVFLNSRLFTPSRSATCSRFLLLDHWRRVRILRGRQQIEIRSPCLERGLALRQVFLMLIDGEQAPERVIEALLNDMRRDIQAPQQAHTADAE